MKSLLRYMGTEHGSRMVMALCVVASLTMIQLTLIRIAAALEAFQGGCQ